MRIGKWIVVGIFATLTMDLGGTFLRRIGLIAGLDPRLIGRWFASLAGGHPFHRSILDAPPVRGELAVAFVCHYAIGVSLALIFYAVQTALPLRISAAAEAALALGYGMLTNALPYLIMYPAMGFGVLGLAAPRDLLLTRSAFALHVLYGAGLAAFHRIV